MGRLIQAVLRRAKINGKAVHNILKLINKKPRTLHELKVMPSREVGDVGRVHIKNALDILETTALIDATETPYRGGTAPKKTTYQITALGKETLRKTRKPFKRSFSDVLEEYYVRALPSRSWKDMSLREVMEEAGH